MIWPKRAHFAVANACLNVHVVAEDNCLKYFMFHRLCDADFANGGEINLKYTHRLPPNPDQTHCVRLGPGEKE